MKVEQPKRPRQYASEIMALPTKAQRRTALEQVPEHYRELVALYVRSWFEQQKAKEEMA